jgi:hypothetical protein
VILRGVSLDELVAEAGRALGGARSLFGPAPADGGWSSTQALATGRDAVGQVASAASAGWSGGAAEGYRFAAVQRSRMRTASQSGRGRKCIGQLIEL